MSYTIETDEETRTAVVRFVGDTPYRSGEDASVLNLTAKQFQDNVRARAKATDRFVPWLRILECAVRRHIFINFKIESTEANIMMCARCYYIKFIKPKQKEENDERP